MESVESVGESKESEDEALVAAMMKDLEAVVFGPPGSGWDNAAFDLDATVQLALDNAETFASLGLGKRKRILASDEEDSDSDGEESSDGGGSGRARKRAKSGKKGGKKGAKKKASRAGGKKKKKGVEDEYEYESDDGEKKMSALDEALEALKVGRLKPRRNGMDNVDDTQYDDVALQFVERMNEAYAQDLEAFQAGTIAMAKKKMLREVVRFMGKSTVKRVFVEHGGLRALRNWLKPAPDGILPPLDFRIELLKALRSLPVDLEEVKRSGIGRVIRVYKERLPHGEPCKALAADLMNDWMRRVFNIQTDPRALSEIEAEQAEARRMARRAPPKEKPRKKSRPALPSTSSLGALGSLGASETGNDSPAVNRARVPKAELRDFLIRPASKIGHSSGPAAQKSDRERAVQEQLKTLKSQSKVSFHNSKVKF